MNKIKHSIAIIEDNKDYSSVMETFINRSDSFYVKANYESFEDFNNEESQIRNRSH